MDTLIASGLSGPACPLYRGETEAQRGRGLLMQGHTAIAFEARRGPPRFACTFPRKPD